MAQEELGFAVVLKTVTLIVEHCVDLVGLS